MGERRRKVEWDVAERDKIGGEKNTLSTYTDRLINGKQAENERRELLKFGKHLDYAFTTFSKTDFLLCFVLHPFFGWRPRSDFLNGFLGHT